MAGGAAGDGNEQGEAGDHGEEDGVEEGEVLGGGGGEDAIAENGGEGAAGEVAERSGEEGEGGRLRRRRAARCGPGRRRASA